MDKNKIRAIIKFFHLERKTAREIKSRLSAVFGFAVYHLHSPWVFSKFKLDRTHTNDKPHSGWLPEIG